MGVMEMEMEIMGWMMAMATVGSGWRERMEGGGSKCYCIPIDYKARAGYQELNVDADCADHEHSTEPGGVSVRSGCNCEVRTQMLSRPGRRRGAR